MSTTFIRQNAKCRMQNAKLLGLTPTIKQGYCNAKPNLPAACGRKGDHLTIKLTIKSTFKRANKQQLNI